MKAKDLTALLNTVPDDSEVRILTADADGCMFERTYTAQALYNSPDAKTPHEITIDIEYDAGHDKTDICENDTLSDNSEFDMGPLKVIESREPFKQGSFEYKEYRYLEGHRPNSVWNEKQIIDGIHIDPTLPEDFDNYPNENRPYQENQDWFLRPFIVSAVTVHQGKVKTVFTVRMLDGGAWDRSTNYGGHDDIKSALAVAKACLQK